MQSLTDIRDTAGTWLAKARAACLNWIATKGSGSTLAAGLGAAMAVGIGIAAVLGTGYLIYVVLGALFGGASHAATTGTDWLVHWSVVQLFVAPIAHFLTVHAAGTGIDAHLLQLVWACSGAVIAALGMLDSRGARIAWPLYGAASAAMAWFGTDIAAHRPLAAGAAGVAWGLLSVLVLNRTHTTAPAVIVHAPAPSTSA